MTPTQVIAAVVSAWATVWVLNALSLPSLMSTLVGVLVLLNFVRTYRAQWKVPGEGRPDPPLA
jgi:hypothetical protein